MRRDPRKVVQQDQPLPLHATGIVLSVWVGILVILAFVIVPILFATCGPTPGVQ